MTKKIIAVLLVVMMVMAMVLTGCGKKEVTEADLERIANHYFGEKFEGEKFEWKQEEDKVVTAKAAYILSAESESGKTYCIAIIKDGSGVYSYGLTSGKAARIGSSNVD